MRLVGDMSTEMRSTLEGKRMMSVTRPNEMSVITWVE